MYVCIYVCAAWLLFIIEYARVPLTAKISALRSNDHGVYKSMARQVKLDTCTEAVKLVLSMAGVRRGLVS